MIRFVKGSRQSGRTTLLIKKAATHGHATIVVPSRIVAIHTKGVINEMIKSNEINNVPIKVISIREFVDYDRQRGLGEDDYDRHIYFDDVESCLEALCRTDAAVHLGTIDDDRIEDIKKFKHLI